MLDVRHLFFVVLIPHSRSVSWQKNVITIELRIPDEATAKKAPLTEEVVWTNMSKVKIDETFISHVSGLQCLMSQSIFPNNSMKTQQLQTNDLNQGFNDEHQHG